MRRSKYNNKRVTLDGITFDSLKEGKRYSELKLLVRAGEITNLECHPSVTITINGIKVCRALADFAYFENGKRVFEDIKGGRATQTPVSRLKRKLVEATHPNIDWRIVT